MLSCLDEIERAAAKMAAAADKAVKAKAKIHSPSRVARSEGRYWGRGLALGFLDMENEVLKAAERLISLPSIETPDFSTGYAGELSPDYDYSRSADYTIEVPLSVDGREFARATVSYTQAEIEKEQTRSSRKRGVLV